MCASHRRFVPYRPDLVVQTSSFERRIGPEPAVREEESRRTAMRPNPGHEGPAPRFLKLVIGNPT